MIAIRVSTRREAGRGHVARCEAIRDHLPLPVTWFADPQCDVRPPLRSGDLLEYERDIGSVSAIRARAASYRAALLDSYELGGDEIRRLSELVPTLVLVDGPPFPEAAVVVSPNLDVAGSGRVVGGAAYLPIARALAPWRGCAGAEPAAGKTRVLVAFGGVDSSNRTALALQALSAVGPGVKFTCALPPDAPHYRLVADHISRNPDAVLADPACSLADIYARHDVAIGAPGVSQAERAYCGLPTVLVAQNPAQVPLAEAWVARNAALIAAASVDAIANGVRMLVESEDLRASIRAAGLALVDGDGAARVAAKLMKLAQE